MDGSYEPDLTHKHVEASWMAEEALEVESVGQLHWIEALGLVLSSGVNSRRQLRTDMHHQSGWTKTEGVPCTVACKRVQASELGEAQGKLFLSVLCGRSSRRM